MEHIGIQLSPEASRCLAEEEERVQGGSLSRDELICGMLCYAWWAKRQAYKDPTSIESRLREAGETYRRSEL